MTTALPRLAAAAALLLAPLPAPAAQSKFNWDAIGTEFCRLTLSGDYAGLRPLFSEELKRTIDAAASNPSPLPPRLLFQSYNNDVSVCQATTRNAALVEVRRSNPGGAGPAWSDYLVIVPEADGTTRIDDVLFATRRSDTLRTRLGYAEGPDN